MHKDAYPFYAVSDSLSFYFTSNGPRGKIIKGVLLSIVINNLSEVSAPVYNLALGDLIVMGEVLIFDDAARSGNGDMPKIITTVAQIAIEFLRKHHDATLSFQGSIDQKSILIGKNQRNILYQRAINSNWSELSGEFRFWGVDNGVVFDYQPGNHYQQILVKRR